MGATLVAQVIANWSHVSDRAFRVLIAMAVTARDNATKDIPKGVYFGGQEHLTLALARSRDGSTDSAIRTVKRAIQELTKAGAIQCTQPAVLGSNAVYKLTLNAIPMPVDNPTDGSTYFANRRDIPSPPGRDTPSPPRRDTPSPDRGTSDVPTSKEPLEEPLEEREKEERVGVRTDVAVVALAAAVEKPNQCPNPECILGYTIDRTQPKGKRTIRCPDCAPAARTVTPFQRRAA